MKVPEVVRLLIAVRLEVQHLLVEEVLLQAEVASKLVEVALKLVEVASKLVEAVLMLAIQGEEVLKLHPLVGEVSTLVRVDLAELTPHRQDEDSTLDLQRQRLAGTKGNGSLHGLTRVLVLALWQ